MAKHNDTSKIGRKLADLKIGESYWVQCEGYRTIAVFLGDGKWKSFARGTEVLDFIHVC
jgi:hypothetical protein